MGAIKQWLGHTRAAARTPSPPLQRGHTVRVADHTQLLWGVSELVAADQLLRSPIGHHGAEQWLALQPTTPTVAPAAAAAGTRQLGGFGILQLGEKSCNRGMAWQTMAQLNAGTL